ncbi:MAG: hypothetical protein V2A34_12445, partial [Lentisphaerota bacterium]
FAYEFGSDVGEKVAPERMEAARRAGVGQDMKPREPLAEKIVRDLTGAGDRAAEEQMALVMQEGGLGAKVAYGLASGAWRTAALILQAELAQAPMVPGVQKINDLKWMTGLKPHLSKLAPNAARFGAFVYVDTPGSHEEKMQAAGRAMGYGMVPAVAGGASSDGMAKLFALALNMGMSLNDPAYAGMFEGRTWTNRDALEAFVTRAAPKVAMDLAFALGATSRRETAIKWIEKNLRVSRPYAEEQWGLFQKNRKYEGPRETAMVPRTMPDGSQAVTLVSGEGARNATADERGLTPMGSVISGGESEAELRRTVAPAVPASSVVRTMEDTQGARTPAEGHGGGEPAAAGIESVPDAELERIAGGAPGAPAPGARVEAETTGEPSAPPIVEGGIVSRLKPNSKVLLTTTRNGRPYAKPYRAQVIQVLDPQTVRIRWTPSGKSTAIVEDVTADRIDELPHVKGMRRRAGALAGLNPEERKTVVAAAREFNRLIERNEPFTRGEDVNGWENKPFERDRAMARSRHMKAARTVAAELLGERTADLDDPREQARLLPKLKGFLARARTDEENAMATRILDELKSNMEETVPEEDLPHQAIVWKDGEWYQVDRMAGKVRLTDGNTIELDRWDPVDVAGILQPGDTGYDQALKEFGGQRMREEAVGLTLEGESIETLNPNLILEQQTERDLRAEKERKARAEQRQEMLNQQAAPLAGTTGDLTADMFGEGETPLFNERRAGTSKAFPAAASSMSGAGWAEEGAATGRGSKPADDPGLTMFPMELPEAVDFARRLAGGLRYPRVVEKIRALHGTALGVYRGDTKVGGQGIELRVNVFRLVHPEDLQRLKAEAAEYARTNTQPGQDTGKVAQDHYLGALQELTEQRLAENPRMAGMVLWHEIGHWIDDLPDHERGRGNILGQVAALKNYIKEQIQTSWEDQYIDGPFHLLTPKERAKISRETERALKAAKVVIEEIRREVKVYAEVKIKPEDITAIWTDNDARQLAPELYAFMAGLDAEGKKRILKAALKGIVDAELKGVWKEQVGTKTVVEKIVREVRPDPKTIREKVAEAIRAEMRARGIVTRADILTELEPVIAWWHGTEKMPAYFVEPAEMYADAISVLANNPAALKTRAPTFWGLWQAWQVARPEIKTLWDDYQAAATAGRIRNDRDKRQVEAMREADKQAEAAIRARLNLTPAEHAASLAAFVFRASYPLTHRAEQAGGEVGGRALAAIRDMLHREGWGTAYFLRFGHDVGRAVFEEAGIPQAEFELYLQNKHIAENRQGIASMLGMNPAASNESLREQRARLGDKAFEAMETALERWAELRQRYVIEHAKRKGTWSEELYRTALQRVYYTTVKGVEGDKDPLAAAMDGMMGGSVGPKVYAQKGYLGAARSPMAATLELDRSIMEMGWRNDVKRTMRDV